MVWGWSSMCALHRLAASVNAAKCWSHCRFCVSFQMTSIISVCGVCHRACRSLCCVFLLIGYPFSLGVFSILFHMWYHILCSNHSRLRQLAEAAPFSITGFWALCSRNLLSAHQHVLSSSGKSLWNTATAEECPITSLLLLLFSLCSWDSFPLCSNTIFAPSCQRVLECGLWFTG